MQLHNPLKTPAFPIRAVLLLLAVALLVGCPAPPPDAQITTAKETRTNGDANDADDTTPDPQQWGPVAGAGQATDGPTRAAADAPTATTLGGSAHAKVGGKPDKKNDSAVGRSFSRVVTNLVVNKQGAFVFDIGVNVKGLKTTGHGFVEITVLMNVLKGNGDVITDPATGGVRPDTAVANVNFKGTSGAGGAPGSMVINGDATNPDPLQANGDYTRTLTGPNGGTKLAPGNYLIELELRIVATAPKADTPPSTADVDAVTLSLKLH